MSNLIFPQNAGLKLERTKTPEWKTVTQVTASGKETRTAMMSYPRWHFSLDYEFLQQELLKTELTDFIGFYNQLKGAYDTFLYNDPYDNSVTDQAFGIGTGSATAFQLVRTMGGFTEPLNAINGTPIIKINGTPTVAFTLGATGIITFNTAPLLNDVLTWTGSFYFRCRMEDDTMEFNQFMKQFWAVKKINFVSVK